MDLGCGKGEFLAGLAEIYPKVFFIGIEVRKRVAEKYFLSMIISPILSSSTET